MKDGSLAPNPTIMGHDWLVSEVNIIKQHIKKIGKIIETTSNNSKIFHNFNYNPMLFLVTI